MSDIILLKDIKRILSEYVILRRWNEKLEDYDILLQTTQFSTENISEKYLNSIVCDITTNIEDFGYVTIELK